MTKTKSLIEEKERYLCSSCEFCEYMCVFITGNHRPVIKCSLNISNHAVDNCEQHIIVTQQKVNYYKKLYHEWRLIGIMYLILFVVIFAIFIYLS